MRAKCFDRSPMGHFALCSELNFDESALVLPNPGRTERLFCQRSPVLYGGDQPILNRLRSVSPLLRD